MISVKSSGFKRDTLPKFTCAHSYYTGYKYRRDTKARPTAL